jgi:hypothetical protein
MADEAYAYLIATIAAELKCAPVDLFRVIIRNPALFGEDVFEPMTSTLTDAGRKSLLDLMGTDQRRQRTRFGPS